MSNFTTAAGTGQIPEDPPDLHAKRVAVSSIPIIDFSGAYSSDLNACKVVAENIRKASVEMGFFYIRNHGIPQTLIDQVFAVSRQFFTLPLDEKMKLHVAKHEQHAGYIPIEGERLQDHDEYGGADQKESLEVSIGLQRKDETTLGENQFIRDTLWLADYSEARNTMHAYYEKMWRLVRLLNRISALAVDLPQDFFVDMFSHPITNIRLLRYPPLVANTAQDKRILGCGEHSDYLYYTLLAQDEIGGLEVLNKDGEWLQAPPIPETFVVNTGDLISHWTNDLFASTVHRVTINQSKGHRYSIAFFTGPNFDATIECLPACTDETHPPKYPPITTGDYLYQRLSSTVQNTKS